MKKLLSSRGETLVELLIAITVMAIAISLLSVAIATANRINRNVSIQDERLSIDHSLAVNHSGDGSDITITVTVDGSVSEVDIPAVKYGENGLYSYEFKVEDSP